MKSLIIIMTLLMMLFVGMTDAKNDIPVTYLSYVDNLLGFYKVTDLTTHEPSPYENRTLIINEGDTVTWINDADNVVLTITSEEKLFSDKRLNVRQRSSYTFNQIGTYTVYIKEYSSRMQIIIVNSIIETPEQDTPVATEQQTPIQTIPIFTPIPTVNIITTPTPSIPNLPSFTQIASIIVGLVSIFMTYIIGKRER